MDPQDLECSSPSSTYCSEGHQTTTNTSTDPDTNNVCSFYTAGKCRFGENCHNLHPPGVRVTEVVLASKKTHSKPVKCKYIPEETQTVEKKPPLKTAGDVRKRIQWDPDLPQEYFTVGYLDRFSGVIEKPFTHFSWEHIATVDLDQLAIPQHRIQFFKYKGVKVWDKTERLDHVFGSAGNVTTIHEVIEEVEAKLAMETQTFDPDEESDDDNMVLTGGLVDPGGMMATACQKAKEEQLRATHFFCVRVNSEEVRQAVATVQEKVVQEEPVLRSCAMPGEILHITLAMVNFATPDALLEGMNLLQKVQGTIKELLTTIGNPDNDDQKEKTIHAQGLSTFGARVLYSTLQVPTAFTTACHLLHQGVRTIEGAVVTNHFDFVPHMTLLKINRTIARERRSKYMNSSLYSDYIDCDFGTIDFNNLHLCAINDIREPDGFYVTCKSVEF
ncbi:hypothetical protein Pcinc_031545 [Petrolisthes cinctipes]|uniref:C3H1-type domain-containing protein n=1 Tax=Petrolisthes cinctipes TaxID=88211 RepID=A0AAE1K0V8_PETCI|nr:hypothetical protein Pcinc_031545 [Petrolisthes cinctipes]